MWWSSLYSYVQITEKHLYAYREPSVPFNWVPNSLDMFLFGLGLYLRNISLLLHFWHLLLKWTEEWWTHNRTLRSWQWEGFYETQTDTSGVERKALRCMLHYRISEYLRSPFVYFFSNWQITDFKNILKGRWWNAITISAKKPQGLGM